MACIIAWRTCNFVNAPREWLVCTSQVLFFSLICTKNPAAFASLIWRGSIKDGQSLGGHRVSGILKPMGQQHSKVAEAKAKDDVSAGQAQRWRTAWQDAVVQARTSTDALGQLDRLTTFVAQSPPPNAEMAALAASGLTVVESPAELGSAMATRLGV